MRPPRDRYPSAGIPAFASLLPVVLGRAPARRRIRPDVVSPEQDRGKASVPFSYMQRSESVDTPPLTAERDAARSAGAPQEEGDGKAAARSR